jgi:hypothetical protein
MPVLRAPFRLYVILRIVRVTWPIRMGSTRCRYLVSESQPQATAVIPCQARADNTLPLSLLIVY